MAVQTVFIALLSVAASITDVDSKPVNDTTLETTKDTSEFSNTTTVYVYPVRGIVKRLAEDSTEETSEFLNTSQCAPGKTFCKRISL